MNNEKKILMLCYYFPPIRASAVARTVGFVSNLPSSGYIPIVLTVKESKDKWGVPSKNEDVPEDVRIIRSIELNLNKPIDLLDTLVNKFLQLCSFKFSKYYFRENICIPDTQIAWMSLYKGVKYGKQCKCIYVSCSPFSAALSACLIKKIVRKPLVVDFRDAWTLNPHALNHTVFHRAIIKIMEKWVLNTCDALLLNTQGALKLYQDTYPQFIDKFYCVPNGYNKLNMPEIINKKKFKIIHVGSFYGDRKPDALLDAILELDIKDEIEFVQVGKEFNGYENYIGKLNLTLTGPVKNETALEIMQSASLLYLKQGRENKLVSSIAVAAKTYEYLSTGIPLLCDCPPGDNMAVVEKYSENSFIANKGDKTELKELISTAYQARSDEPKVNNEFVEMYSREALTKSLAEIINKVIVKC